MLAGGIKVFTIRGIEIRLDYSWFIIFALVTYSLAQYQFPSDWPALIRLILGLVTSVLFFLSVLLHELSHSFVAQSHGIKVPRITLFIFGGAAQIAEEPRRAQDEFLMAAAGPAMSVAVAVVSGLLWQGFAAAGFDPLALLFQWLAIINVSLAVFNLLPGFPLDGGRVLRALIWGASRNLFRATRIAAFISQGVAIAFMVGGGALVLFAHAAFNGLWLGFIGLFLLQAARQTLLRISLQEILAGHLTAELMWTDCVYLDADTPLSELFYQQVVRGGRRCFPVLSEGRVIGLVSVEQLREVPFSAWPHTPARAVMMPAEAVTPVRPETPLSQVLELMLRSGRDYLPVVEGGIFKGLISREALAEFLRVRQGGRRPWLFSA